METLSERLNLTTDESQTPGRAVKIDRNKDVNIYETLCLYCANNNVAIEEVPDSDFEGAVWTIETYGAEGVFYFWIDED